MEVRLYVQYTVRFPLIVVSLTKKLKKREQIKGQNGTGVSNVYDGTNMKIRKKQKNKKNQSS